MKRRSSSVRSSYPKSSRPQQPPSWLTALLGVGLLILVLSGVSVLIVSSNKSDTLPTAPVIDSKPFNGSAGPGKGVIASNNNGGGSLGGPVRPTPTYDGAAARATLAARRTPPAPGSLVNRNQPATTPSAPTASSPAPVNPVGPNAGGAQGSPNATRTRGGSLPGIGGTPTPSPLTPAPTSQPSNSTAEPGPSAPVANGSADQHKATAQEQLERAWNSYKQEFIQGDGRVLDPMFGGITTSEGQSYALLRAVWSNDRDTFERTWSWTRANLRTSDLDKLFAFKWGKADDGTWTILDLSSATDADSDIALALILAARRWKETAYQKEALEVLTALWQQTVTVVNGKPYITAGEWATGQARPALNPSYLAPYAYRIFAQVDAGHNWAGLVDTSYEVVRGCSEVALDGVAGVRLPANWCGIDRATGQLTVAQDYPILNTNYGYDAFRTMWRLALDYKWFGEKRALDYLTWSDTLRSKWKQEGKLVAEYDYGGKPTQTHEDLAIYAGDLANFLVADPALADAIVAGKLLPAFQGANGGRAGWGDLTNYYTQNWVWFGLALYSDSLPNPTSFGSLPALAAPTTPAAPITPGSGKINK